MQSEFDNDLIKIKGYFVYRVFPTNIVPKDFVDGVFCITKWEISETIQGSPVTDRDGILTLVGNFYEMPVISTCYTILAKKVVHPVYGEQYNLIYINQEVELNTIRQQKVFLQSFLTEKQVTGLFETFESPLDIIKAHDVKSLKTVKGIGDYIANCIIDRYEESKDMSEIYIELSDYGLTPGFIRKLMKTYKNSSALIKAVKENPYQLIDKVNGIGFITADNIALKGGISPKSPLRIAAFIQYFLEKEAADHGHSYITAGELMVNLYDFFGGKNSIIEEYLNDQGEVISTNIGQAISTLVNNGTIILENSDTKTSRKIYLTYYYLLEQQIASHLIRLLNAQNNFSYYNWRSRVEALENIQGFNFDEEQLNGIKLGLDKQVCLICGGAGCGKTSLISGILAALPNYSFAQTSLSGKAAARMQEVTGQTGSTIHRLLGYNPSTGGFTYNESNPLPYDIIILDEVSLVGGEIFLDLIKAIKSGTKLIMLGDLGQLEAIGALNLASDVYHSPIIPTVELTKVHRQAARSGIISSAHLIRSNKQLFSRSFEGQEVLGELKDMVIDIQGETLGNREKVLVWFKKLYHSDLIKEDIDKIQIIAPVKERGNSCVYNLNNDIQSYLQPLRLKENNITGGSKEKPYTIYEGDKVLCIKNNYHALDLDNNFVSVFNGWTGIVKEINDEWVIVDFPLAGTLVQFSKNEAANYLVLGYAVTIHKWQGSGSTAIIGVIDYSTPPTMLTCQLLYTLVTRAKKYCVLIGQNSAICKAIENDFVSQKRTFLQQLLEENYKIEQNTEEENK